MEKMFIRNTNKNSGFTLIELMVTIAILSIIIAIAVPSYRNQAVRANRTEAIDALLSQAAFQQRQFTVTNSYSAVGNFVTDSGMYRIRTIIRDNGQTYLLRAIPLGGQQTDTCGRLELNHFGQRVARGGDNTACWAGRNP